MGTVLIERDEADIYSDKLKAELAPKVEKANKVLKKLKDYIEEHNDMFGYMDLKLHDVSFYCYRDLENDFPLVVERGGDNIFYDFCEEEYNNFDCWCDYEGIDFEKMRRFLGRTSKFYLTEWDNDDTIRNIINQIIEKYSYYNPYYYDDIYVNSDCQYLIDEHCILDDDAKDIIERDLDFIINDLWKDFHSDIEGVEKVYKYITDFKENQVENFKEWLQNLNDYFEEEVEAEKKHEADVKETLEKLQNKYSISDEDFNIIRTLH